MRWGRSSTTLPPATMQKNWENPSLPNSKNDWRKENLHDSKGPRYFRSRTGTGTPRLCSTVSLKGHGLREHRWKRWCSRRLITPPAKDATPATRPAISRRTTPRACTTRSSLPTLLPSPPLSTAWGSPHSSKGFINRAQYLWARKFILKTLDFLRRPYKKA